MRIAMVTHVMPYPADSGTRIRVARVVGALRRRHEVTLLSLEAGDARGGGDGAAACRSPSIRPARVAAWSRWRWRPRRRRRCGGRCASGARTPCTCRGRSAPPPPAIHHGPHEVPAVIDEGCVYHLSYRRAAALAPTPLHRARGLVRTWRLRRFERTLAQRASAVVAVSADEAAVLHAIAPTTRVVVAPNGVDAGAVKPSPPGDAALFVGLLSYAPNRDAMAWFAREVLPRLAPSGPEVLVAGRDPGPELRGAGPRWRRSCSCWGSFPTWRRSTRGPACS